jgi:NADPH:quinone reductase-like Zn-dependent oxidoreductase
MRLMNGLRRPNDPRLGVDVAGQAEAIGRDVTQFKPGDEVFGSCRGALAEYVCTPESALVMKPANVTFEQAAAVPTAAYTALQGLRNTGRIQAGQKVLINGAAGGVGTLTVQIAKWYGADVTGVCSTRNVNMVRSIGADHVIDYTREDFTKSGQHYDLIFDLVANRSMSACRHVLNHKGIYIGAGILGTQSAIGIVTRLIKVAVLSRFVSQDLVLLLARRSKDDLTIMHELLKTGKLVPIIDTCYKLNEVPEAIRHLETRHVHGKLVVTI